MADMQPVAPMTGAEYAQLTKTDALTAIGLQDSLLAAIAHLKRHQAEHPGDPVTAELARGLLAKAVTDSAYLKAAGTQELATRYFHKVIDDQGAAPEKRDEKIAEFVSLGGLAYTAGDVNTLRKLTSRHALSMFSYTRPKAVGLAFKKATKDTLGIAPTGLEHFQKVIRTPGFADDVAIIPAAFGNTALLDQRYQFLKTTDRMPGGDRVIEKIAAPDVAAEAAFMPIIETALRLQSGSPAPNEDVTLIHAQAKALRQPAAATVAGPAGAAAVEDAPMPAITAEEGKIIGRKILNAIPRLRASEATAEHMLDITTGRDASKAIAPVQDQGRAAPAQDGLQAFLRAADIAERYYGAPSAAFAEAAEIAAPGLRLASHLNNLNKGRRDIS